MANIHNKKQNQKILDNLEKKLNDVQQLYSQKKFQLAYQKINKLIKTNKDNAITYNYRGIILIAMKNYRDAISDFKKSLSLMPDFAEAISNMGMAYQGLKKNNQAILCYEKAIQKDKNALHFQFNLASLLLEDGQLDQSISLLKQILFQNANIEHAHHLIAEAYIRNRNFDLAYDHHLKSRLINPHHPMNDYLLGVDCIWRGDNAKAEEHLTRAIKLDPTFTKAIFALSGIKKISPEDKLGKDIIGLNKVMNLPPEEKIFKEFTLSKIYSDANLYAKSFEHLEKGNQLMKKLQPFNIREILSLFETIKNFYLSESMNLSEIDKLSCTPIFIVGMPRSGSSLLEQILTASELVYGAGEINDLHSHFMSNIKDKKSFIDTLPQIKKNYLQKISSLTNKQFITDKLPLNFYWLGFIKQLFPGCKIIHTTRDPIDVCFSIYNNLFVQGTLEFAYDRRDIIEFYHSYEELMVFWESSLEDTIMTLKYEDVVSEPEQEIKKVFNFIGIEFKDEYLDIEKNRRSVQTASATQIRGGINKNSIKKWQNFKLFISEFIEEFK